MHRNLSVWFPGPGLGVCGPGQDRSEDLVECATYLANVGSPLLNAGRDA